MSESTRDRFSEAATATSAAVDGARCVTCDAELHGDFCHVCGERVIGPQDLRVAPFLRRAAAGAFDLDSRLWRTYRTLLSRPGQLTAEFVHGRRQPYLHPLQVFLLTNLVFFIVLGALGGFGTFTTRLEWHVQQPLYGETAAAMVAEHGTPGSDAAAAYARRFDEATPRYANSLVIVMVPLVALALALLYLRRRLPFVQHLVMALHFMSFVLLLSTFLPFVLYGLVFLVPPILPVTNQDAPISLLILACLVAWLMPALRRANDDTSALALVRAIAAGLMLMPALLVYRAFLFFAVYFALE